MSDSLLEALLRDTRLTHGRICLYTENGGWYAAVTHFHGHLTTTGHEPWRDNPVDALKAALIEDDRKTRDMERRYQVAQKAGGCDATTDDEFEDLFG